VAAAVKRNRQKARAFISKYLNTMSLPNTDANTADAMTNTLFELYRMPVPLEHADSTDSRVPNWVSGARYSPGEVFYDPVSGSFQPRVIVSGPDKEGGLQRGNTTFNWNGFMVTFISTPSALGPVGWRRVGRPAQRLYRSIVRRATT